MNKCMYVSYTSEQHSVEIVKSYKHNKTCYTQGLLLKDEILYESCGMYGYSTINKYHFPSMDLIQSKSIDKTDFAEGITIVNNSLVLLTWKEHKIHIFDPNDLTLKKTLSYPFHGWGATSDLTNKIFVSDGSNKIREISIENEVNLINEWRVQRGNGFVKELNEMEVIDNKLFVNIYWEDKIVVIDLLSKNVIGEIWCNIKRIDDEEVFNGITKIKSNNILVTGKYWDKMYEIRFI